VRDSPAESKAKSCEATVGHPSTSRQAACTIGWRLSCPLRFKLTCRSTNHSFALLWVVLHDANTVWQHHTVALWYGHTNRAVEIATGTAVWYHSGLPPVPIRWLLVRDPRGELAPQAFLCTDLSAAPVDILQ
jgi:hypothetical protein